MGRRRKRPGLCIEFKVWDKLNHRLATVVREGRVFLVDGVPIKLFPIRVMAEAIDRIPRTIVDWERAGKFPKPMYAIPNARTKRWYSEHQILKLNEIWMSYRHKGKARHFPVADFLKEIRNIFYKIDTLKLKEKEAENG